MYGAKPRAPPLVRAPLSTAPAISGLDPAHNGSDDGSDAAAAAAAATTAARLLHRPTMPYRVRADDDATVTTTQTGGADGASGRLATAACGAKFAPTASSPPSRSAFAPLPQVCRPLRTVTSYRSGQNFFPVVL